nr:putative ribonuclease H-like domain-containing protein [Tanacetum cinerariifolium]
MANPLALVAQQQSVYHPPQHHPTQFTNNSLTRSQQAATRNRGKAIVNSSQPIYGQEPLMVDEDDETSKDKEIDKLMALISLSFKKIYKPTNNNLRTSSNIRRANQDNSPRINKNAGYENQQIGNVVRARETVGSIVVQKSGIQCYNCKEFGHVARECQKPKRAKDAAYHKEKMLLYKQEEAGIQLNAEQADWKDDTDDDELEDQELEAHYMYMGQLQQVSPDAADSGPNFDDEPLQKQSQEQLNNDKFWKQKESNSFRELNVKYFEIQDLKSQLQDEDIAISELNKLNEKMKGKSLETKFEKPSVIRQPNAFKIQRQSILEKFLGMVKFGNDQIAPILGYGYLKSTCYIRDLKGNDLLIGSRGIDLYSITLQDTSTPNPICLMAKASSSQAWLWHRRLSHLNFDTINLLSKHDIVIGLPKLKFVKDHLCSSSAQTPQQNDVVKRQNRTLVEAARTMLSATKVPLFFWAEAIATTDFTQNHSLVIPRHEKTPYHIINGRNLLLNSLTFWISLLHRQRWREY